MTNDYFRTEAVPVQTDDPVLLRHVLDAIPSFVLVVDEDVRILDYNAAAAGLFGVGRGEVLSRRGGDVLHCLHALDVPEGCGQAEFCKTCVIRTSVQAAFQGCGVSRRRAAMTLRSGDKETKLYALITASRFSHQSRDLVLLVIEDISEIAELQRLVPICMYCRKVRDDDQLWTQVEAYFQHHWDLRFSHGMCPECATAEMEKINRAYPPTSEAGSA